MKRFQDPMEGWPNSDLLLDADERNAFAKDHPQVFRVADFEELREEFSETNAKALAAKTDVQRVGVMILVAGALGVALLGISGLLASALATDLVQGFALLLILGAGGFGVYRALGNNVQGDWLELRLKAERLRQYHFQYILLNWNAAAEAMADDVKLRTFTSERRDSFEAMLRKLSEPADPVKASIDDILQDRLWLHSVDGPAAPPVASPQSEELMEFFRMLRLGIQLKYSSENLKEDQNTPMANAISKRRVGDVLAFFTPVVALMALVTLIGPTWSSEFFHGAVIVMGTGTLLLRAIDIGLATTANAERTAVYHAQLQSLSKSYETASHEGRFLLMQQVEAASYEEMRAFLKSNRSAEFII